MAKLSAYYSLCPLFNAKSLLGVTQDATSDFVIVTLSQNMCSRYKLLDQKQVSSWRTKEKFSSPVFYDKTYSQYVAAFNQNFIKLWTMEDNFDKAKRYRFNIRIYTLISNGDDTFIIFANGAVHKLTEALEQRKTLNSEKEPIDIVEVLYKFVENRFYVGLIIKESDKYDLHITIHSEGDTTQSKIEIYRGDCSIKSSTLHYNQEMKLMILWSDGSLYSYPIDNSSFKETGAGSLFSVVTSISSEYFVSMYSLNENYIAMYGADCNGEGALLIIYNTQFKVTQCKQPFKLFTDSAKIWSVKNFLFLPVRENLAIIPYHLEMEQLAALIGSHKLNQSGDADVSIVDELEVTSWDSKYKLKDKEVPEILEPIINEFIGQGMPESGIIEIILPNILHDNNVKMLDSVVQYFQDIPEKYLVKILKFLLNSDSTIYNSNTCPMLGLPESLQPFERLNLINNVLRKPFSEVLLVPHLRSNLTLDEVVLLLKYLNLLLSNDCAELPSMKVIETEIKCLEWCCVLVDSNYQKIILSKEDWVKETLMNLQESVEDQLNSVLGLVDVVPLLEDVKKQKVVNREQDTSDPKLSVEYVKWCKKASSPKKDDAK